MYLIRYESSERLSYKHIDNAEGQQLWSVQLSHLSSTFSFSSSCSSVQPDLRMEAEQTTLENERLMSCGFFL